MGAPTISLYTHMTVFFLNIFEIIVAGISFVECRTQIMFRLPGNGVIAALSSVKSCNCQLNSRNVYLMEAYTINIAVLLLPSVILRLYLKGVIYNQIISNKIKPNLEQIRSLQILSQIQVYFIIYGRCFVLVFTSITLRESLRIFTMRWCNVNLS